MNIIENKLNRSRSESDIFNISSDNNTFQNSSAYNSPAAIRRTVIIEEIFTSSHLTKYTSCTEVLGNNSSGIGPLQNSFNHIRLDNIDNKRQMKSRRSYQTKLVSQSTPHLDSSSGVVPMDVDSSFDWDERYPKLMGTDFESSFNRSKITSDAGPKALDKVLKHRTLTPRSTRSVEEHVATPRPARIAEEHIPDREFNFISERQRQQELTTHIPVQKKESSNKLLATFLVMAVIVASYVFVKNENRFISVNSDIKIENLQKDLSENVHEQPVPIEAVVRSLEQLKNWPGKVKVLGFIGSQGVGKTFVANIVKKHFVSNLVHDLFGVHLSYKSQQKKIIDSINDCCVNLVVVDDLTRKDDVELFAFVHSLPRNHFILVISIFNIQYTSNDLESEIRHEDIIEIRDAFDQSGLHHELVLFQEFTPEQVEGWLKKQLSIQNATTHIQDVVTKTLLNDHESNKRGLKGLHSKMLMEMGRYKK